jgi:multidrug resistance protein
MSPTLRIVTFINFVNALSFTVLIPNIYGYGRHFGLSDLETSCLFAIYSIAQFFATPIIGKLSDRVGRKPLLVLSLAGTIVANLIAGTASTATILFIARFLDGITGGNVSVAQAIITDITKPEERARAFGLFGASLGVGFVMGPLISYFAIKISIGAPFLASSMLATIALILTVWKLPETLKPTTPKPGTIFDLGLKNIVSGLAIPGVGALLVVTFLTGTTFTMFTFAFQPYYLKVLGQNMDSISLLFFSFGVLGVLMQTQGIKILAKRFSTTQIMFLGLFFRSACFALMPVIPNIVYFIGISLVFSIFNSLVQPMISTLISINTKPAEQGMTSGLNAAYLSISNGIGPILAAVLIDKKTIEAAEKIARDTGTAVSAHSYASYSYPLYIAGICTFGVLFLAVRSQRQYNHPITDA